MNALQPFHVLYLGVLLCSSRLCLQQASAKQHHTACKVHNHTIPNVYNFESYLQQCQSEPSDAIQIREWMGRSGNHFHQLVNAIYMALASGRSKVLTPGFVNDAWNISTLIKIDKHVNDGVRNIFNGTTEMNPYAKHCDLDVDVKGDPFDCSCVFKQRCRTTVAQRRKIYQRFILPMIEPSVFSSCSHLGDETVTIHIRDGDVSRQNNPYHIQPPCAFFRRIIATGNGGKEFKYVQLVHSGELPLNPCVADIETLYSEKLVDELLSIDCRRGYNCANRSVRMKDTVSIIDQTLDPNDAKANGSSNTMVDSKLRPTPLMHDVCAILQAKNIVATASSFSITLMMMSSNINQLFVVDTLPDWDFVDKRVTGAPAFGKLLRKINDFELAFDELCNVFPRVVMFQLRSNETLSAITAKLAKHHKVAHRKGSHQYFFEYESIASMLEYECTKRTGLNNTRKHLPVKTR